MKLKSNKEYISKEKDRNHPDVIFFGKDIDRYSNPHQNRYFNFDKSIIIGGTKDPLVQKAKPKILIQAIRNLSLKRRIIATLEKDGHYFIGTLNGLTLLNADYDFLYILGLINTNLINYYFSKRFTTISLTAAFLGEIPIYNIKQHNQKMMKMSYRIVNLDERMFKLNKDIQKVKTSHKKEVLQRQINATDKQIDKLVYKLYDLTEEEIEIVEEGAKT